ncbi:MAG: ABC transporter permease subunit [Clostridiales bacterium]|jgi:putative aldouronate transport system permease protein|nr:ABC transporter permease subunit [Clostridiales bacterium]
MAVKKTLPARLAQQKYLLAMLAPAVVYVAVFAYMPMWGMLIAFFDYNPGLGLTGSPFVGLRYFREFLRTPDFPLLMRNTLAISALNIICGTVFPVLFAVLLNELFLRRMRRVIQTISYLPHFISFVVVANIASTLLSPDGGLVNRVLISLGVIDKPIFFLTQARLFWFLVAGINVWKEMGWGAIIYIAAITNIDPQLYEAATVDGAGRFRRIWHITLPGILPTVIVLTIMALPGLLEAGFDPSFLLGNPMVSDYSRVLDTHIYTVGLQQGRYPLAAAVGLMRMGVGLALILSANAWARRVSEYSLF